MMLNTKKCNRYVVMNNKQLNVFEISRMAMHNGPGIRTMVHFKGCNLGCTWCSTPESKSPERQLSLMKKYCIGCKMCEITCRQGAVTFNGLEGPLIDWERCNNCFDCTETCCANGLAIIGRYYKAEQLHEIITRDQNLYKRSGGGVTFSGGEALLSVSDELIILLKMLKRDGISIGFDTAGCVEQDTLKKILPYTDFFLWDVKLLDDELHKKYTGRGNKLILNNLKYVDEKGIDLYIRCPIIPGVNDNDEFFDELLKLCQKLKNIKEINLLPFHKLGESRYEKIGKKDPYCDMKEVSREHIAEKQQLLIDKGYATKIIG